MIRGYICEKKCMGHACRPSGVAKFVVFVLYYKHYVIAKGRMGFLFFVFVFLVEKGTWYYTSIFVGASIQNIL